MGKDLKEVAAIFLTRATGIISKNAVILGHIIPCFGNQTNITDNGTKKVMESTTEG